MNMCAKDHIYYHLLSRNDQLLVNISFYYAIIYLDQVTLSSHIRTMGACNRGFPSKRAIYTTTKIEKAGSVRSCRQT